MALAHVPAALPFFMKADDGERFCLYHEPNPDLAARGAILYVPPFAEEMNKSRRMAALQARALARAGFGVLQIDLYGCGDSSGDLADARWDIWLRDLDLARAWLRGGDQLPFYLWGLRLGALLALDFARRAAPDGLILWQAVASGRAHLNQFIRMQSAARLFAAPAAGEVELAGASAGAAASAAASTSNHAGSAAAMDAAAGILTATATAAVSVHAAASVPAASSAAAMEVAGYTLSAQLMDDLKQADAAALRPRCPLQWLELASGAAPAPGPAQLQAASALLLERWRLAGSSVSTVALHGPAFWSSVEISECPDLLDATVNAALTLAAV